MSRPTALHKRAAYPAYKPSGVEWIDEVPIGWGVVSTKRSFDIRLGKMLQNSQEREGDQLVPYLKALHVLWRTVVTDDLPEMGASQIDIERYGVASGDLLVCEGGEVGRAGIINSPPDSCIIQNALHRVRARNSGDIRFLMYVLHAVSSAGWFDVLCNRATIAHFTGEKFGDLRIPLPSVEQQQAIAAFLDRETARIDALIEKKQRQIELLQEKRSALISRVVTKGLDPNAPMKDSGVEWLGEIPRHWALHRVKIVFQEAAARSTTGGEELLTVSHITGVTRRSEKDVNMFMAESLEGYKKCELGDLAINTMWAWMGALGVAAEAGIVSPSYNVYKFRNSDYSPWYYDYLFRTKQFIAEIICYSKGIWSSRLRLYPEEFYEIRIPIPPNNEQAAIVAAIRKETGHYDILQTRIEASIATLHEYRTSLISVAVTGKIDVRKEVS